MSGVDARETSWDVRLSVLAGGALGTAGRAALLWGMPPSAGGWPWATFAVNLAGAALLGWLVAGEHWRGERSRAFLTHGLCGALTTFSAFQLEVVSLAEAGHASVAVAYLATSVLLGLLIASAAGALRRGFTGRRGARAAPS